MYDSPVIVNYSEGKFLEHTERQYFWLSDTNEHTIKMLTNECIKLR